jgi:acylphosphatase
MRKRFIFKGNVQGVGFRFTTLVISRGYQVGGFVRNLSDGTVEMEAEGPAGQVRAFLDEIRDRMGMNIRSVSDAAVPDQGNSSDFTISY